MTKRCFMISMIAVTLPARILAQSMPTTASAMHVTIDELVGKALESAPTIQAQRLAIDRARGEAEQAALRPNPTVMSERRDQLGGSDSMTSVSGEWPLELFRRGARVKSASAAVATATAEVEEAERQLAGEVRRRAVALLVAQRRLALTEEISTSLGETYRLLARRVDEGAAPPLARDQAFVEWQRVEAQRPARRADVRAASADLCAVVGLPPATALELTDDPLAFVGRLPASPEDVRSDVRTAVRRVDAANATLNEARQMGRFDLGVFGGYSRMDSGFSQFGFGVDGSRQPIQGVFHNLSIGLSVVVPIANRNQGAVTAARAEQRAAELQRDAARLEASADLVAARARDEEARSAVHVYGSGLRSAAKKNLDVVRESFSLGRLTLSDVLAEERRYLDVEMSYVDALAVALLAHANLLQALGVTR
jgi:cobalt-zinc-cadmium efflux system outer membrane protein